MLEPQEPPDRHDMQVGMQVAPTTFSSPPAPSAPSASTPSTLDFSSMPGALDLFADDAFGDEIAPPKPWYRRAGWIAVIAAVLIVALLVGGLAFIRAQRTPPVSYVYSTVRQGTLSVTVSATGPLQAAAYAANFSVSGKLAEIDVQVGQQVTAGQQLAKLDTTALQDALNQAQAQANQAYDTEQNQIYTCDTERNPPPNCVQAAEDAYNAALAQLQTAKDNLAAATLLAPHAGVVGQINGSVGATPSTGSSSGSGGSGATSSSGVSGFIVIEDTSVFQVVASVNEADIANLAVGQAATFTLTAFPGQQFSGTVSAISPFGTSSSNVVTYPVTIDVDMSSLNGAKLFPGMTATLSIIRAQRTNVLLVPNTAVTFARSALTSGLVPITTGSSGSSSASGSAGSASTSTSGITASELRGALAQARQMLTTYEQQNKDYAQDNPTANFVLETTGTGKNLQWSVKPVVVGLTDGSNYEVLAGLGQGERVVTGQSGATTTTTGGSTTGGNGRNIFGGGGRGGGGNGGSGGNGGNGGNGQGGGGG